MKLVLVVKVINVVITAQVLTLEKYSVRLLIKVHSLLDQWIFDIGNSIIINRSISLQFLTNFLILLVKELH